MIFGLVFLMALTIICLKVADTGCKAYSRKVEEKKLEAAEKKPTAAQKVAPKVNGASVTAPNSGDQDSLIASNGLAFDFRTVADQSKPAQQAHAQHGSAQQESAPKSTPSDDLAQIFTRQDWSDYDKPAVTRATPDWQPASLASPEDTGANTDEYVEPEQALPDQAQPADRVSYDQLVAEDLRLAAFLSKELDPSLELTPDDVDHFLAHQMDWLEDQYSNRVH